MSPSDIIKEDPAAIIAQLRARLAYVEACWIDGDEVQGTCEDCGRPISSEEPTSHAGPSDGHEKVCQDCMMPYDFYGVIAKARHCPQEADRG